MMQVYAEMEKLLVNGIIAPGIDPVIEKCIEHYSDDTDECPLPANLTVATVKQELQFLEIEWDKLRAEAKDPILEAFEDVSAMNIESMKSSKTVHDWEAEAPNVLTML